MNEVKVLHLKNGDGDFLCQAKVCERDARFVIQIPGDSLRASFQHETFCLCLKHYESFRDEIIPEASLRIQEVG